MKINLKNTTKNYGEHHGIIDANLEINSGQFIALVGPNGSGKSTLCKLLVGIIAPSKGTVLINNDDSKKQVFFSQIGYSPQTQVLDWYSNVKDNIYLAAKLSNIPNCNIETAVHSVLELMNLLELKDSSLIELSGGQLQRVQVAMAMVHKPDIYILDEPTVGLDIYNSVRLMEFLQEEVRCGKIVILSSHELDLIEDYVNTVLFLENSKVKFYDSLDAYLNKYSKMENYDVEYDGDFIETDNMNVKVEHYSSNKVKISFNNKEVTIDEVLKNILKKVKIKSITKIKVTLKETFFV